MVEWPLVGREGELRQLSGLVTRSSHRGVVLAGPAGVGKSRLAAEFLIIAERAGFATARVTATRAASGLPLGALAPLLVDTHTQAGAVDDKADLLRRSAVVLVEGAGGRRLVLLVDDAHLLDDTSATVVHQLASTNAALVVATVRTGEAAPDAVLALWKDGLAERMNVGGLGDDAVEQLLSKVVGDVVDPAAITDLAARSQGNVLFLRELVLGAIEEGALVDDGGIWRLRSPLSPTERLVELVESRLVDLDHVERALLELLSFGEPLGSAELTALAEPSVAEALERRALLASRTNGRRIEVRLAHPIYGEVLRARMPATRVRSIVRSLADAVEATGARRREDTLRVASWRLLGGGGRPDVMLAGAHEARWRYDFPLAEQLARAAGEAGAGFDATLLAAQLASLQGRGEQAEAELAALAPAAQDDAQRTRVALARIDNSFIWAGQHDELHVIDDVERNVTDPIWRNELEGKRLTLLFQRTNPRVFIDAAGPLLQRARGAALAWISLPAGWGLGRLGRIDDAAGIAAKGQAARSKVTTPLPWYAWWHDWIVGHALTWAGRLDDADTLAMRHYRQALADRSTEAQGAFAVLLALVAVERGHVRTAARRAREAVALNQQLGRPLMIRFGYTHGTLALALGGDRAAATELLAASDALDAPALFFDAGDVLQVRAWVAVAHGHLPEARRHLETAAELGADNDPVGEASALHALARLGYAAEVSDRLAAVAEQIEGTLAPARALHAAALTADDPVRLEEVSLDFEAMGADLLAAESAADAAVARRRAGQARQAAADQRRAGRLADRCEGAVTPALQCLEARVSLTVTERDTAVRAAAGASNKAIANDLHLSVRTVENRLQRVYEKLGVSGRTGLADALNREGGPDG